MKNIISQILSFSISIIYLQSLYFKFTAHPDSIYIFTTLGVEPWGRLGLGTIELFTSILVFSPKTRIIGVTISFFIIIVALLSHLLIIGIEVHEDKGKLFFLALTIFVFSTIYLIIHRNRLIKLLAYFKK